MDEIQKEKERIKSMKDGETIYLRMFHDGGVQILKYNLDYFLFEIPIYGGRSANFEGYFPFKDIDKMIALYDSWS